MENRMETGIVYPRTRAPGVLAYAAFERVDPHAGTSQGVAQVFHLGWDCRLARFALHFILHCWTNVPDL